LNKAAAASSSITKNESRLATLQAKIESKTEEIEAVNA
jgi:hypothetical protein